MADKEFSFTRTTAKKNLLSRALATACNAIQQPDNYNGRKFYATELLELSIIKWSSMRTYSLKHIEMQLIYFFLVFSMV